MAGYYGPGIYRTACEGLEEHTICGTRFRTEQDKFDFQEKHCYKNCERCKHGKMLDESYGN